MAVNYIDYDVLTRGEGVYHSKADEILEIVRELTEMNTELMDGWNNDTARAFVERMKTDHFPKLEAASAAIEDVSQFITKYMANRQEEDSQGASSIQM